MKTQLERLAAETHIELKAPTPEQERAGSKNDVFLGWCGCHRRDSHRGSGPGGFAAGDHRRCAARLVAEQQRAGAGGGVVMEGRDIGTVVFPNAELKIFLDASPEVRAERRWKEHQEKGDTLTVFQVLEEVRERDKRDRERKVSPLVRADDAVIVDNTAMDVEETARLIVMLAREREKDLVAARGNA